jgi:hypothetical protein
MQKKTKKIILIITLFVLLLFIIAIPFRHRIVYYYGKIKSRVMGTKTTNCQDCNTLFNDGIQVHEKAYKNEGIVEQKTDDGLFKLEEKAVLKNIESNDFYIVKDFNHSQPLLLPKAIYFLDELSKLYQQKCTDNDEGYFPFVITSATRSINSVTKLMEGNSNAIENSSHLHGKTFDISYTAFSYNKNQLKLFVKALSELKNQNKCFVKYERNGCLHITVN